MPDNLARIADAWHSANLNATDLYITCARGLSPQQLAERMADHEPVEVGPSLTIQEASRMVDLTQTYCVGRIGQSGDWSFIVECGGQRRLVPRPGSVPRRRRGADIRPAAG